MERLIRGRYDAQEDEAVTVTHSGVDRDGFELWIDVRASSASAGTDDREKPSP